MRRRRGDNGATATLAARCADRDVGFQSPNVEATTIVFAAALLLILVVTLMNVLAITLRNHLRRKYAGSAI